LLFGTLEDGARELGGEELGAWEVGLLIGDLDFGAGLDGLGDGLVGDEEPGQSAGIRRGTVRVTSSVLSAGNGPVASTE
jgi:hypothetical protein